MNTERCQLHEGKRAPVCRNVPRAPAKAHPGLRHVQMCWEEAGEEKTGVSRGIQPGLGRWGVGCSGLLGSACPWVGCLRVSLGQTPAACCGAAAMCRDCGP